MRKTLFVLIFSLLVSAFTKAQIPKEAFPLVNSLSDLWTSGKTEAAIDSSLRLYKIYSPFLIESYNNSLSQLIKQDRFYEKTSIYLEEIIKKNNQGINHLVNPIYLWSKTIHNTDNIQLEKYFDEMVNVLGDSSYYESNAERYALLILNQPNIQKVIERDSREKLLLAVIRNLESYPNLEVKVKDRKIQERRAWNRYLLAFSYYLRYKLFDCKEEYLMKASRYSPDDQDVLVKYAYFYDAALLTGDVKQIGFQNDYLKYLTENHRIGEALAILSEITFNSPTDQNLKALKDMYLHESHQTSFNEYWHQYINQKGKKVPSLIINYAEETLDLTKNRDCWVYIDVWGTWCSPCVKELPTLQEYYIKNAQQSPQNLKIYTFSYSSQNLKTFMKDNNYTFPVYEIDKKINDDFEVTGYPTKILISPTGSYLKIPFNTDWRMYLKNYILME